MTAAGETAETDLIVVGSGAAGLAAALTAAVGGLSVVVLEKSDKLGGTSAMSGAGTWIPANHHARAAGVADSADEAVTYLRATAPTGWENEELPLWRTFAVNAARVIELLERETPLRFELIKEPDPLAEKPGGKTFGRMLSTRPLSRRITGRFAPLLRRSTYPQRFTYRELHGLDPWHRPFAAGLRLAHTLAWRWLTDSVGQGGALVVGLLKGCLDRGCRIELETRVVELISEGGAVAGVVREGPNGRARLLARRGVVLATGGFEWDPLLRERHFPGPVDRLGSPRTNDGDGQRLALSVGARLDRMDQANIYPTLPTFYEHQPHGLPLTFQAEPHAIVVDRHGLRFVSEYDYNIGEALDRRDPKTGEPVHLPSWVIGDDRYLRRSITTRWYGRKERDWATSAPSLDALAGLIGLPAEGLKATTERYNGFCRSGRDADFGRGESVWERYKAGWKDPASPNPTLGAIEDPPFVALRFNRSILGTKGGARTNARGQVLRPDGSVIPKLYAAGNAMANPIGTRAVGAGTTIGPCMTWGYISAMTALGEAT